MRTPLSRKRAAQQSVEDRRRYLSAMCCMGGFLNEFEEERRHRLAEGSAEEGPDDGLPEFLVRFFSEVNMTFTDLLCSLQLVSHWQSRTRRQQARELAAALEAGAA
eukprot:CAMPEP_0177586650 /NCGR_PEP_ID=MMETSP0419_2-20121207/5190_1 /TAXON_ID=582737 /ORGANISM="Tetraselmis sp., Strain GSL018" /LENGTH=105 /DNA_ID=CAMNT_0019076565 /DNA_START=623 /DNA_END=936 /DNA_ORIENTATION=+